MPAKFIFRWNMVGKGDLISWFINSKKYDRKAYEKIIVTEYNL
jgi:hypothetical protein